MLFNTTFNRILVIFTIFIILQIFILDSTSCDPIIVKRLSFLDPHKALKHFPCYQNGFRAMENKLVVCSPINPDHFWVVTHNPREKAFLLGNIDLLCGLKKQFINIYPHIGHADLTYLKNINLNSLPCLDGGYCDKITEIITNEDNIKKGIDITKSFQKDLSYMESNGIIKIPKDFVIFLKSTK
jgi:hypothetical protein